jgi:hypothetical protein
MSDGKKWHDVAQEILETLLKEADEDRDRSWKDAPPFRTMWPPPPAPEHASIAHLLPGRIILSYEIEGEEWDEEGEELDSQGWEAELLLFTEALPQDIYRRCEASLEKFLTTNNAADREGNKRKLSDTLTPEMRASLLESFARNVMEAIIYRLPGKLEVAFNEHWHESQLLAFTLLTTRVTELVQDAGLEVLRNPNEPLEEMKRLLARTAARRRRSLKDVMAACLGAPYFEQLGEHYDKVLPVWKDAKLIYKQNSNRPTWQNLIRAAYPDMEFDDDLIARLSGRLNDLPSEVQAKLSEKGGDSKPSSIALEHAARLCGAHPYQYSLRHLYNIKNETKVRKEIDDEGIDS